MNQPKQISTFVVKHNNGWLPRNITRIFQNARNFTSNDTKEFTKLIIKMIREGNYNFLRCTGDLVKSDNGHQKYCLLGGLCHLMGKAVTYDALYDIAREHNWSVALAPIWEINDAISPKVQNWNEIANLLEFVMFSKPKAFDKMCEYCGEIN